MCHHRGDIPGEIPEWTNERADEEQVETEQAAEELPPFSSEDDEELSVVTDGGK